MLLGVSSSLHSPLGPTLLIGWFSVHWGCHPLMHVGSKSPGCEVALASPEASWNPSVGRRLTYWLWGTVSSSSWASSGLPCPPLPLGPTPPAPQPSSLLPLPGQHLTPKVLLQLLARAFPNEISSPSRSGECVYSLCGNPCRITAHPLDEYTKSICTHLLIRHFC